MSHRWSLNKFNWARVLFLAGVVASISTLAIFSAPPITLVSAATCDSTLLATTESLPEGATSEVPADWNVCKASVLTYFNENGDLKAAGNGSYKFKSWTMARKTVVFKHNTNSCDYAIRTEFLWRGLPNIIENQQGYATPFEGRAGVPDVLSTSIVVKNLTWALRNRNETAKNNDNNGVVLKRTDFNDVSKNWDVAPADPARPYFGDQANWKWQSLQVKYDSTLSILELNMALNFRESYRVNQDGSGDYRWARYGQSVLMAKAGKCESITVKTAYGRTVTHNESASRDCFVARDTTSVATNAIASVLFSFVPFVGLLDRFESAANLILDVSEATNTITTAQDSTKKCDVRESFEAKQELTVSQ